MSFKVVLMTSIFLDLVGRHFFLAKFVGVELESNMLLCVTCFDLLWWMATNVDDYRPLVVNQFLLDYYLNPPLPNRVLPRYPPSPKVQIGFKLGLLRSSFEFITH